MQRIKVVVTGGAGFIGSHIVEFWLTQNAEVHVIDNLRSGYMSNMVLFPDAIFHFGSITEKNLVDEVLEGADYVHHLAALVSVPESVDKPFECLEINVNGLLNVLEASKKHNIKKVVYSSSAAVYGDDSSTPKYVNSRLAPKSPYGITKLDGEYYLNMYHEMFGLGTVSLRYFNVFGERQDLKSQYAAAVPIFINNAIKNEPITIYGDGEQTRDFIYVRDVVLANILAATSPEVFGVYNVALGTATTITELANNIIKITGSQSKVIYTEERKGDIKHSVSNIDETVKALSFSPKYDLNTALERTISLFK